MEDLAEFEMLELMADEHSFSSQSSLVRGVMKRAGEKPRRRWAEEDHGSVSDGALIRTAPQKLGRSMEMSMHPLVQNHHWYHPPKESVGSDQPNGSHHSSADSTAVTSSTLHQPTSSDNGELPITSIAHGSLPEAPAEHRHSVVYEKWLHSLRTPSSSVQDRQPSHAPAEVEVAFTSATSFARGSVSPSQSTSMRHASISSSGLPADAAAPTAFRDTESLASTESTLSASDHSDVGYGDDVTWDETSLGFAETVPVTVPYHVVPATRQQTMTSMPMEPTSIHKAYDPRPQIFDSSAVGNATGNGVSQHSHLRHSAVFQEQVSEYEESSDPLPSRLMMKMFPALRPKPAPVPHVEPTPSSVTDTHSSSCEGRHVHIDQPAAQTAVKAKIKELESHVESLLATRMATERTQVGTWSCCSYLCS